jgi:4a-hydroxytetrahydrobiopterin dehydratase
MTDLKEKHCSPCRSDDPPLDPAAAARLQIQLHPRWQISDGGRALHAAFEFRNYWRTTAFVNAVAWIAHTEDHHPDICFGYKACEIEYRTHAIGGLSENDFICAARIDALLQSP